MFYGIIMDVIRDGILRSYGPNLWKRIVHEVNIPVETFDFFARYDDSLLLKICDCMVEMLNDGTRDVYLEFFGTNFIHYFHGYGYDKILRVSGRTFRDFLFSIDQLHDSNRFTFPQMHQPLFHVTEENEQGAILIYKSVRHGLASFAIGGLKAVGALMFNLNNIDITIQEDLSTNHYSHIVLRLHFDNTANIKRRWLDFPSLPSLSVETFFRVFPFSILMDSSLRIRRLGKNVAKIFPSDTPLIGRLLNEVFQLIRPDIHFEWDIVLSYGRHIVFLMENNIPLRTGSSGKIQLKGQMKYLREKNMLWFLCHPVLGNAEDLIAAGLHLTDLNLFDSTSDLLITATHQERELEDTVTRQRFLTRKASLIRKRLAKSHRANHKLISSTIPGHISHLLQSGSHANSISECQPLVTILFAQTTDLNRLANYLDAAHAISFLNRVIVLFDSIADRYDVFKVDVKTDASYMFVAGIHDPSYIDDEQNEAELSLIAAADENDENDAEKTNQKKDFDQFNATENIAALSLELANASKHIFSPVTNEPFDFKFGFHSGMAIGGIVGGAHYRYCLFGDTVKTASQMASTSEVGRIHLSQTAYTHLVASQHFLMEYRGQINIKNRGPTDTYWLTGFNSVQSATKINKNTSSMKCPFTTAGLTFE